MEITEEERNRLAALLKRKASTVMKEQGLMGLFTISSEICSPDSFMITPLPLPGFPYTGEFDCLQKLSSWLSFVDPSHYTQNHGGEKASVYKLRDYDMVLKCLKKVEGVEPQEIPWRTLNVVHKVSVFCCQSLDSLRA